MESDRRVAVIMLNYNMPEVIEQNIKYIRSKVQWPLDIFLVDQSEDAFRYDGPAPDMRADLSENLHATQGFNLCCRLADSYNEWHNIDGDLDDYFAYWVITTTGLLDPDGDRTDDCLTPCAQFLYENRDIAVIQPAYRDDSIGFWDHLRDRGTGNPRQVHMIEHTAALFNGEWFRDIEFMEPQILIHGTDLWYSYLARLEERGMYVHEGTWIKRYNDNMHDKGRSFEKTAAERTKLARKSLERFGQAVLGPSWEQEMMNSKVTKEMI